MGTPEGPEHQALGTSEGLGHVSLGTPEGTRNAILDPLEADGSLSSAFYGEKGAGGPQERYPGPLRRGVGCLAVARIAVTNIVIAQPVMFAISYVRNQLCYAICWRKADFEAGCHLSDSKDGNLLERF